jgi:hypothetical protein
VLTDQDAPPQGAAVSSLAYGTQVLFAPSVIKIVAGLSCIAALLVLIHSITQVLYLGFGMPQFEFLQEFNLEYESNIPTYFSSTLLLANAVILFMTGSAYRRLGVRDARYWLLLAAAMLYVSLDEAASLHEGMTPFMRQHFGASGPFFFGWVIPASFCVVLLGLMCLRFIWRLEPITRNLFLLSAFLYLGGVVGMEMVGGRHAEIYGSQDWLYFVDSTTEETLELAGTLVFMFAILDHLRRRKLTLAMSLSP